VLLYEEIPERLLEEKEFLNARKSKKKKQKRFLNTSFRNCLSTTDP
jgi:hypothetical protein